MPSTYPKKAKVTVTLSPNVLRQLDALLQAAGAPSRSQQLVEEALRRWLEEQAKRDLENQTEAYYRTLSPAEQEEDKQWSRIATEAAGRLWKE